MNYIQVWIGNKPSNEIIEYIQSVLEKVSESDTYTFISSKKWSFLNDKVNWIKYEDYISKMFKDNPKIKQLWKSIPDNVRFHWARSDIIRYHYLSKNLNSLYLDTDIILKSIPKFDDKIYFGKFRQEYYDCNIIYNGSNLFFFEKLLNYLVDFKLSDRRKSVINRDWGFSVFNSEKIRKEIKSIDNNCYQHIGMWRI